VSDEPTRDEDQGLSEEELDRERIEQLPAREAMSIIGDVSIPLDPDVAADVLLDQGPGDPTEP
jgi:hypothetical protein